MRFSYFKRKFQFKLTYFGRISVQWVEVHKNRPFVHTFIHIFFCWVQNGRRINTRYAILYRSYLSILLIFKSKQSPNVGYIMCKFEENQTWNTDVRVPQSFFYKMAAMTSSDWNFQNLRKNCTGKHPREYLRGFPSKTAKPFGL